MGDRVIYQVVSRAQNTFSPAVYGHWSGSEANQTVHALRQQMAGRKGDVDYIAARLVQCAIGDDKGDTGFGIWNTRRVLTAEDSQGDAGVVLIDAHTFMCECLGGYLAADNDGLPVIKGE